MKEINGKLNFHDEFSKISDDLSLTKFELSDIKQKIVKVIEENKNRSNRVMNRTKNQREQKGTILDRITNLFKWTRGRKS